MGGLARSELDEALHHYSTVVDGCSASGDWSPFADLFTEDVTYIEHVYGTFQGREAVRSWIVDVMAPFPQMRFEHEWVAFDDENAAIVLCIANILDHPDQTGVEFRFPNWSRLVYGGSGLFSSEEDVYNPSRDAGQAIGAWIAAGGKLLSAPKVSPQQA